MTPPEAYQRYAAIKLHFALQSYDFFRYNGQVKNLSMESFDARNDKVHFEKLARHYNPDGLLVAHLIDDPEAWVGDIVGNDGPLIKRQKVIGALSRYFLQDLETFGWSMDNVIRIDKHENFPRLLRMFLAHDIQLETASIILDVCGPGLVRYWLESGFAEDFFVKPLVHRLQKYQPWLVRSLHGHYSREHYAQTVVKYFSTKGLEDRQKMVRSAS